MKPIEFDTTSTNLQGPTINWCRGLHNTEIHRMELREAPIPVPLGPALLAVDIFLMDGSIYRLQRVAQSTKSGRPNDTIESLRPSDLESRPHISISFSKGHCSDLFFIMSVCYGIMKQDRLISGALTPNYFALALILNAVRMSLPRRNVPESSGKSSVESLWNVVFETIEDHGHTFWADTAADHAKHITRKLIYRAACDKVSGYLSNDSNGLDTYSKSAATSIILRNEALLEARELSQFNTWDEAWDRCWKQLQSQTSSSEISLLRIPKLKPKNSPDQSFIQSSNISSTGRQAGRLPSRIKPHSLNLSTTTLELVNLGLIGPYWTREPLFLGNADLKGKRTEAQPIGSLNSNGLQKFGPPGTQSGATSEVVDVKIITHSPATHQSLENQNFWISAVEIAVEKVWDVVWPIAVQTGEKIAQDLKPAPQKNRGETRLKGFNQGSSLPLHRTMQHPAVSGLVTFGNLVAHYVTRSSPRINLPNTSHRSPPTELEKDLRATPKKRYGGGSTKGAGVLKEALSLDQSHSSDYIDLVKHVSRRYQQEYQNEKANILQQGKEDMNRKRNRREGPFSQFDLNEQAEEAWNLSQWAQGAKKDDINNPTTPAWKLLWIGAWKAVWEETWHIAVTKGVEFGMEKVLDENRKFKRSARIYEKLERTEPHQQLHGDFCGAQSPSSSLELFRSMMRELHHLFESHQRAVHTHQHDQVKITFFPGEKSLLPKLAQYAQEPDPAYVVSHFQMQSLVIEKWVPEHSRGDFRTVISEVWHFARSAYRTLPKTQGRFHNPDLGIKAQPE